jgi:hypothetical protein
MVAGSWSRLYRYWVSGFKFSGPETKILFYDVTWLSFSSREPTVVAGKLARTLLLDSIACPKPGKSVFLIAKHTLPMLAVYKWIFFNLFTLATQVLRSHIRFNVVSITRAGELLNFCSPFLNFFLNLRNKSNKIRSKKIHNDWIVLWLRSYIILT